MALHNGATGKTSWDIESASRHEVLPEKQVIIGCGGGFRHECANRYSPVAQWMGEVDLALEDESQQYGNLGHMLSADELQQLPSLANDLIGSYGKWLSDVVPRTALAVLWLAMHQQDVESMVALTLTEAAGLMGRQNWSLILSSSAKVSRVTYETVIAVRYPELDIKRAKLVEELRRYALELIWRISKRQ